MRKIALILLILSAVGIYSYDAVLLLRPLLGGGRTHGATADAVATAPQLSLRLSYPVRFTEQGKSPFAPTKEAPRLLPAPGPRTTKAPDSSAPTKPRVVAPEVSISGIMWNPSNPLVMLLFPDGSSTVAKVGQDLGNGIVVKKIEQKQVLLVVDGRNVWLSK